MKVDFKDIVLLIILGFIVTFAIIYINRNNNEIDASIEYNENIKQLDNKLDSLKQFMVNNDKDKKIIYTKLDSIGKLKVTNYETFQRNYNNLIIGAVSDDSVTRYIAKSIYNWQRYSDTLHQIRK